MRMPVRIFTIPFDRASGCFFDDDLNRFLLNKRRADMKAEFFMVDGLPYWSVFVDYDPALDGETPPPDEGFDEAETLLLERLKHWRREKAQAQGVPVYIISTNSQITEVVRRKPRSMDALRGIRGFGKKKTERHGGELLDIVGAFLQPESGPTEHAGASRADKEAPSVPSQEEGNPDS